MREFRVDDLLVTLDTSKKEVSIEYVDRPVRKKMHLDAARLGEFTQALALAVDAHLSGKFNVDVHKIPRSQGYTTTIHLTRSAVLFFTKKDDGTGYSSPYYELSLGNTPKTIAFLIFALRVLCGIREG